MEDILTSNVFSFFKYSDRKIFLYRFLHSIGLSDITPEDAVSAEFFFWPQYYDGTEPDLVLVAGKYYLLFEAKYHSGFGKATKTAQSQLVRELLNGGNEAQILGKTFRLVAVTTHYSINPSILREIPAEAASVFIWINWQQITLLIEEILMGNPPLPPEMLLFAEDFYTLLVRKNLRIYAGQRFLFAEPVIHSLAGSLFFNAQTAAYRGDFIGFREALTTHPLIAYQDDVLFFTRPGRKTRRQQTSRGRNRSLASRPMPDRNPFEGLSQVPKIVPADTLFFKEYKNG
jgi:hypothetical protein